MKLLWTRRALAQLDKIATYIAEDNPAAASKLLAEIKRRAALLQQHPFAGRRSEVAEVRELVVHANYILSYRVSSQAVEIIQVWHAAQRRYH